MAEIRSLAVVEDQWNQGIGSRLILSALSEARDLGIRKVFALTYRPWVFEKHGFVVTDKGEFPQKVWAECVHCSKFPDCDEIGVLREVD